MRVEVGMKKCSKKKLMRSTWADHVEKWEVKSWQRAVAQKVDGEMQVRTIEMAMRDCIKSGLERVGKEWKNDR